MSLAAGRPRPLLNAYSLDGGYWSRRLPTFKDGQMRFLSPQLHQVLDYVTIAAFALSPTLVLSVASPPSSRMHLQSSISPSRSAPTFLVVRGGRCPCQLTVRWKRWLALRS